MSGHPDHIKEWALNPRWREKNRVHDWRNYISSRVREMWDSFTLEQKMALVESADEYASREHWD